LSQISVPAPPETVVPLRDIRKLVAHVVADPGRWPRQAMVAEDFRNPVIAQRTQHRRRFCGKDVEEIENKLRPNLRTSLAAGFMVFAGSNRKARRAEKRKTGSSKSARATIS